MQPRNVSCPGCPRCWNSGRPRRRGIAKWASKRARRTRRGERPRHARRGRSSNLGDPRLFPETFRPVGEPVTIPRARRALVGGARVVAGPNVSVPQRMSCPPRGRPKARGTGAEVDRDEGVGGPNTSDEVGKRVAPKPMEQRRSVSRVSFRREPWALHRWRETGHRNFWR
jgi:hypothetical protein